MEVMVFSKDIVPIGSLDCFSSAIVDDNYWDVGTFEINAPVNPVSLSLLKEKQNRIIWIKGEKTAGILEKVDKKIEQDGDSSLQAKGHLLDQLYFRRIVWGMLLWINPDVVNVIKGLMLTQVIQPVNLNRAIPHTALCGMNVRYIRDSLNGSTANGSSHWVEITAQHNGVSCYDGGTTVTASFAPDTGTNCTTLPALIDGVTTSTPYVAHSGAGSVTVDLGSIKPVDYLQIWHYWGDGRTYHHNKTEVSADGINWTTVFDSDVQGEYAETNGGHQIHINDTGGLVSIPMDSYQVTGEEVGSEIVKMAQAYDYGFETIFDPRNRLLKFNMYRGVNRSKTALGSKGIVFSVGLDELLDGEYIYDCETYKNTALIAGEGEGTARKTATIDTGLSGFDRFEGFVDARDLQQQGSDGTTITDTDYTNMLKVRGYQKLGENQEVETYEGAVRVVNSHYTYGVDFYKGDTVTLVDERLDVEVDAKITGVEKTWDDSGFNIRYTFGFQKPTLYSKLRRRNLL